MEDIGFAEGYFGNELQAACFDDDNERAELLICKGDDPNERGGHFGNALQAASNRGSDRIVSC
jgi:hypothetical protein